ncbi:MAG: hypothetical protein K2Q22_14675, partial [Cytophagales bacterium]|nr:hypothetical protein [Cytophagales bacterium]
MKRENLRCLVHLAKACILSMMICSISCAQNIQRVQRTIRTLASPNFHGRGYVSFGDSIAAVFIKNQLDSLGLTPLGTKGYQRFKLDVNTFPSELSLQIGSKKLVLGKDFIVA